MTLISRKVVYNFAEGNKEKILTEPLLMNAQGGGDALPTAFCVQVFFTKLDAASAATIYLSVSNDGTNFVRVPKEFTIAGASQTTFFIFAEAQYAKAQYIQIGIDTITVPGIISKVIMSS